MPARKKLSEEALEAWTYTRQGVIAELSNVPAKDFAFRATEHSRTLTELAQHIVESGLMAGGELSRTDGNFQRQPYPEFIREYAGRRAQVKGKAVLLALLQVTHDESVARIRAAGEALMVRPIVQFNGEPATRLTWLHHAIGHEEYHRGQIALYARLLGRVPALTQLIEG